jgi:ubiquinone/menaquinone biosynthesis C-methylase UbiE
MPSGAWIAAGLVAVALLIWELWICEGTHFGRRFVVWLYQISAHRYDGIKHFDRDWERHFLGESVANALGGLEGARLLDVGAGTGRLARALDGLGFFRGIAFCLEPASRMIAHGRPLAPSVPSRWLRGWGDALPFASDAFDMVTSFEVLEFTPSPRAVLAEMVRVLLPGGWLLVTNRVGWQARWILGKTFPRNDVRRELSRLGLEAVEVVYWQMDYDLVWARKATPAQAA